MFELLFNPKRAEEKPLFVFLFAIAVHSLAVIFGLLFFKKYSSVVVVFLTVMAFIPLLYRTMFSEAKKGTSSNDERELARQHSRAYFFLILIFVGVFLSAASWFVYFSFKDPATVKTLYKVQTDAIASINSGATSNFGATTSMFMKILMNNFKVLVFCFLFAVIFGLGGIFILTWNATVVGAAMGNYVKSNFLSAVPHGFNILIFLQIYVLGFVRYMIHGIPEMLAYFVGAVAGGMLSAAFVKKYFSKEELSDKIILDAVNVMIISLVILVLAAIIEVYITPALFKNF
ncbi:MAG TPA: stage II sporulation protein M [Candidatus Nanoarchaeia archaeon]|nr:stage II sporulation protein M [Candidatus Nanoarchaeia archaeon]